MSRVIRMLTAATAAGGLALVGLVTSGAASAGTYTQGSWSLDAPGGATYSAQVQQPINADGSSVFNHKSSTIPVQFKVTKSSSFAFESVIKGDSGVTPVASGDGENDFSVLHYATPAGLTVSDITNLTANFNWNYGENHSGGFRWQVEVMAPGGAKKNIMVDYGDASNALQSDTAGSGINMVNSALASQNRDESGEVGGTLYTPWSYVTSNFGSLPVVGIDLVVDGGWGTSNDASLTTQTQDQVINLSTATVGYTGGTSTFTWPAPTSGVVDNSAPAWISLTKTSGATPAGSIDESTLTSTQGDSGGQFRQVDSKYMYNLPVNDLPDKSATYTVGVSFNPDGSSPVPSTVNFGLK